VGATGWALVAIVIFGAALRFTDLGHQAFWGDEAYTDRILGLGGFWDLPHNVSETESAPLPYYLITWVWAAVFGSDEAGIRSLSALLGTLTIPVMYLAVRELSTPRAGLIAAALCACNPVLVWYSQEARAYALYLFLVAASFWLFARALKDPRRRLLAAWAVVSVAAVASFYLAAIPVALEAALLLWLCKERRPGVLVASAVVVVAVGAMVPYARDHTVGQAWIAGIDLGERLAQTPELFLVGNSDPAKATVFISAFVVLAALGAVAYRGEGWERRAIAIPLVIGVVGLAVVAAGRLVDADYFLGRNVLFAWVPLAAAVSVALGSRRLRLIGPAAAGLLCAIGVWLVLEVKRDVELQRVDFRTAAEMIGPPPSDHARMIVASGSFLSSALRSYLPGVSDQPLYVTPADSAVLPPSTEVVVLNYDRPERGRLCWWGSACAMPRGDVPEIHSPAFHPVERSSAGLFTLTRYRSSGPRRLTVLLGDDSEVLTQGPEPGA
jgi:mannosyltransferase